MGSQKEKNKKVNPPVKVKRARRRLYESAEPKKKSVKSTDPAPKPVIENTVTTSKIDQSFDIDSKRVYLANEMIKKKMYWAMGVGVIPLPVIDFVALTALQLKLIQDISKLYNLAFSAHRTKSIILSLLSSYNVTSITGLTAKGFYKLFPGLSLMMTIGTSSVIAGAATFAVGKVFVQHFESGGTLLNLDPAKVREFYRQQFKNGKNELKQRAKSARNQ